MAKSIRVVDVGRRQTYATNDPKEVLYQMKALNERSRQIGLTWGFDSDLYKNYVSGMLNAEVTQYVRIDKDGHIKFKMSKLETVPDALQRTVQNMQAKYTKGEIIKHARETLTEELGQPVSSEVAKDLAPQIMSLEEEVYANMQELYNLDKRGAYKRTKWFKDFKNSHGDPSEQSLKEAKEYISKRVEKLQQQIDEITERTRNANDIIPQQSRGIRRTTKRKEKRR